MKSVKSMFTFYLLRWRDRRQDGWYGDFVDDSVGVRVENAKQYKTKEGAASRRDSLPAYDLEIVEFTATAVEHHGETYELLQRLTENLEISGAGGWDEEPDDREVTVGDDFIEISATFAHFDVASAALPDGGRRRFTTNFRVVDNKLVDDNGDDCPLADEAALQRFVNKAVSWHSP